MDYKCKHKGCSSRSIEGYPFCNEHDSQHRVKGCSSDNWTINRRKNQKRAFKFLTHLMILESSIMVENNGDTWFYLIGLLMQDCAELDNAKLYGKIEKYVNDERAGKHNV